MSIQGISSFSRSTCLTDTKQQLVTDWLINTINKKKLTKSAKWKPSKWSIHFSIMAYPALWLLEVPESSSACLGWRTISSLIPWLDRYKHKSTFTPMDDLKLPIVHAGRSRTLRIESAWLSNPRTSCYEKTVVQHSDSTPLNVINDDQVKTGLKISIALPGLIKLI